jgi:hypothetical protein
VVGFFAGVADAVRRAFTSVIDSVILLVRRVPPILLPEALQGIARLPLSTERPRVEPTMAPGATARAARVSTPMPPVAAAVEAAQRGSALGAITTELAALLGGRNNHGDRRPITVQLQVDGQTLAEATHRADQDERNRSFTPVPTY